MITVSERRALGFVENADRQTCGYTGTQICEYVEQVYPTHAISCSHYLCSSFFIISLHA